MPLDPVTATPAVASGAPAANVTINPDGGENVHLTGGSVATQATTVSALNAATDMTVTTTPTALPSLAAGPKGILVRSHPNNDNAAIMRIASNATANTGEPLARGESYTFESIGNANELLAVLEGSVTGSAKLEVEQV